MQWLLYAIWEHGMPGAMYYIARQAVGDAIYGERRALGEPLVMLLKDDPVTMGKLSSCLESKTISTCLRDIPGNEIPFLNLLEYILNPALGGTPMDGLIGTTIRSYGADGLIYPSARFDCGVKYRDDEIETWWGWNFVDYGESSLPKYDHNIQLFERVNYYRMLRGAIDMDLSSLIESGPSGMDGWAVHGLAAVTRKDILRVAWEAKLGGHSNDWPLDAPLEVERTPWIGYAVGPKPRKPRIFSSVHELRVALATGEITLKSKVRSPQEHADLEVGGFAELSRGHDIWGSGPAPTVFQPGLWCLLQHLAPKIFGIVCPVCGRTAKSDDMYLEMIVSCLACGNGRREAVHADTVLELFEQALDRLSSSGEAQSGWGHGGSVLPGSD